MASKTHTPIPGVTGRFVHLMSHASKGNRHCRNSACMGLIRIPSLLICFSECMPHSVALRWCEVCHPL